ncbi:hypothetical protein AB0H63_26060 [Micromonospora echinospora]|uniref:Uncharacterized protein n=1 Tax=Micromonospora echinospora TaxID=1877 RepID=A0A1C4Y0M5_MICEC|nr:MULTISPECIES: hypothetical protein [Micromonospora]GLY21003.1 hypothetical protein Misp04_07350 [Micromonospora sp. NBRC 101691]SCF14230.1 hypothetical protein GA0070618_3502 [Micromonospora echinospora]
MLYFLIVMALLLFGYAGYLMSLARRGQKMPSTAYVVLGVLNGIILVAVLVWAVNR